MDDDPALAPRPAPEASGTPVGRRVFLGLAGLGAVGVLLGARAQDWLEREVGPLIAKDGTGLASLLPIGRFRIYTVTGGLPSRSRADYKLRVNGLVDRPFELTYDELVALPPTKLTRDFQCVTGWRVPDVEWKGVRLADLMDRAGVQPAATALKFHSFDGAYTEIWSPSARANLTAATTSSVDVHTAITAGRRSIIALKTSRASS